MLDKREVIQTLFDAIDELNEQLPSENHIKKSVDTVLFGNSGKLDSLGLVNLIVGIEQKIEERFRCSIALYEEATSQEMEPFKTIETLEEYIFSLLKEKMER